MKWLAVVVIATAVALSIFAAATLSAESADDESSPNSGLKIPPAGYRDWRLISVAHEEGNLNDLRAVLGNDAAIKAYREGKLPFPDGTIIARLAWSYVPSEENNKALAVTNLSWPGPPRMFSSWSRTQKSTPRPAAGGSLNSTTANPSTRGPQDLLFLPRARQSSRLGLHLLRTLKAIDDEVIARWQTSNFKLCNCSRVSGGSKRIWYFP